MPRKTAAPVTYSIDSDSGDDFMADANDSDDSFMADGGDDSDFDFAPPAPISKSKKMTSATATAATSSSSASTLAVPVPKTKKSTSMAAKKTASAPKKKPAADKGGDIKMDSPRQVLAEKTNSDESANAGPSPTKKRKSPSKKTVEERYQKLTQLEHILVRPDTYIGSVERATQEMYVLQNEEIVEKEITYTPGLYKIYDEILVNAADNKQRDPDMDKLEIEIDPEANVISVKNNGKGIPIQYHQKEKCYVPTLVFGHLLTGSNFDDNEKKTTGGRNGFGAKLANIFSTKFVVHCADSNSGKTFKQVFRNNMKVSEEPVIKDMTAAEQKKGDFVKITFSPDLEKFKMATLDEDIVSLFSKRAYDIAGSMARSAGKPLAVLLNGNKVPVKKFEQYLKLYKNLEAPIAYEDDGQRWEIGIGVSDGTFKQVSFVNSICTSKGGEHVNAVASMAAKKIAERLKKKKKDIKITDAQIKNHLTIFVNCLIENPTFDSQTKETLTTKKTHFGSKCVLSEKFLSKIEKSEIVDKVLTFYMFKEKQQLGKKSGTKKIKLTGITKLDDANFAGSAKSQDCTLILTEGDSAKSLAMSGISVVGRDYYGVFPLKGKPLNVRECSITAVTKNDEIKNIIDILGLKFNVVYDETNIKTLRYGHLMIMADQDHDGSHIKGLIINFFHNYWPSLLDIPGFLQQFITPIVKANKGKQSKTFFTLPEYENWKESTGNDAKGWRIKYYKGLGTSTSAEAKEYFSNLDLHEISFCELSADECRIVPLTISESSDSDAPLTERPEIETVPDHVKSGAEMIELAFSKKMVEDRKGWLNNLKKNTYLDYSLAQTNGVTYSDFINKELILFSQADNVRSIPNIYDGFKPSQRKVLFGCFLKNLKNEMKVAQLCGYIGEKSAYHHGEASLQGTIVNMAQDFTGSNNINLLTPSGQFGTRRMGGKDSASPRYIFTKLEKITRAIYHPDDDALLKYLHEDGESIEPEFYLPIIPMVLVNGAEGIGTGWSTSIPNYNPRDLIANIQRKLGDEEVVKMHPYYFGFDGTIEMDSIKDGSYVVSGKIDRLDETTLHITELPIKSWTQDYKCFLEKMMLGDEKKKTEPEIKDFKENHTDTTVSFTITASKDMIDAFEREKDGLYGKFKLRTKLSTSNMNVFDKHGRIVKFATPEALLDSFYRERIHFYDLRKNHLLEIMRRDQRMLSNKARFVEEVCSGILLISNRKRKEILSELKQRNYELFQKQFSNINQESESETEDEVMENNSDSELAKGYEYLLGMKIWSLTYEKAEQLRKELAEKTAAVKELEATTIKELWRNDLKALEDALDERDQAYAVAAEEEIKAQGKNKKHKAAKAKKQARKKTAGDSDDSDDDYFEAVDKKKKVTKKSSNNATVKRVMAKSPQAKKPVIKIDDEELQSSSSLDFKGSESDENKILAKKQTSKKPKVAPKIPVATFELDSDSEPEESLFDRMQKKTSAMAKGISKPTASIKRARKPSSPKAKIYQDSDDFDAFDTSSYEPASLTPAPKRKKGSKKVTKKPIEIDSDDDMLDEQKNLSEEEVVVPNNARSRPTRERKTIKYIADSDEEDDQSDDDDFAFDD